MIANGASIVAGGTFTGDVTDNGTIDLGGNAVSIVGALTGTGTVTNGAVSGTATLTVNGTGTFSGVIQDGGTAHTARNDRRWFRNAHGNRHVFGATTINGTATLQVGNGGTAGTLGSTTITDSGTLAYDYSNSFNLTKVIGGSGTLSLTSTGGAITQGVAITVGGVAASAATGVTLNGPGNTFSTFSATNSTSGAISLTNTATTLTVSGISETGGTVTVNNTGNIVASGSISAGALTASA